MNKLTAFTLGLVMGLGWLATRQHFPSHLSLALIFSGFAIACLLLWRLPSVYLCQYQRTSALNSLTLALLAGAMIGLLRAVLVAHASLQQILPAQLQGVDVTLRGKVAGIPVASAVSTRFEFQVQTPTFDGYQLPHTLRLHWYSAAGQSPPALVPGDRWRLTVRLKRFHAALSPGAFDVEGWAFRRSIGGRGYVREGYRLQATETGFSQRVTNSRWRLREYLLNRLPTNPSTAAVIALSIGDRSLLDTNSWRTLRRTGTSHLLAISGLHIGLAGLWGGLCAGLIWRRRRMLMRWCAVIKVRSTAAILAAAGYALLAGLAIPTQRAFVMLAVFAGARLIARRVTLRRVLAVALLVVLLIDPLAVSEAGLWLSFFAVALIGLVVGRRARTDKSSNFESNIYRRIGTTLYSWIRLQTLLTLGLAPVLLLLFQQLSVVSVVANLIAIPVAGFVIVPALLVATASFLTGLESLAGVIFHLTGLIVQALWLLLEFLSALPMVTWQRAVPSVWEIVLAATGLFALLLPRAFYGQMILMLGWLPLFMPSLSNLTDDELEVAVLDVGQGLAVVVRDRRRALLFDTGLAFRGGGSVATSIIVPYLRASGIRKLDRIIVSHPDIDHAGGFSDVFNDYPADVVVVGPEVKNASAETCQAGDSWTWRTATFTFLSPPIGNSELTGNDASCVLLISTGKVRVLLTGDIEAPVERQLIRRWGSKLSADILLLGHHGSATSSSLAFLRQVKPQFGVVSAGFRNRHGHPAQPVLERLEQQQILPERTDTAGTIVFRINGSDIKILRFRHIMRRYWHHS